ncbi:DUF4214 domain-containing protein [Roseomonas haemaphysalidis]|uniref:DUF4214 domain-containing protein n=1 Tax=Roseomonas haemaphysalidis TaxID=2768162 RepID=A0ABS3KQF4_9PROT|nr:DUF4214 domain-containing protein [Roseomonas haemaphysalidis]MBO1079262.1 DUF4214 domain-containing protein [Roseomonas haemaphysalidis]
MALSPIARTLIYSEYATWNSGSHQPSLVTFSFAGAAGGPNPTAAGIAWSSFSAGQQHAARQALDSWAAVSGIRFIEVPDTKAGAGIDIRFQLSQMADGTAGSAYYPKVGDISLSLSLYAQDNLEPGSYGYLVLLHEIGHALGLKHPFDSYPVLTDGLNNFDNTVMAYPRYGFATPASLRAADIEAIQYLYGTQSDEQNFSVQWNWDAARGGIRHDGNNSSQSITGTALRDIIFGYGGDDVLNGGAGDDMLFGGTGLNRISGGAGTDVLATGLFRAQTSLSGVSLGSEYNDGSITRTVSGTLYTPGEHQVFNGIEVLAFGDGRLVFDDADPVAQVVRMYQAALGRQPDAVGRESWTTQLLDGAPLVRLAEGFLGSAEFQARFGWQDDAGFVATAYRQALGREGEASGQAFWQGQLAAGMSRAGLLAGFSESAENHARTAPLLAKGLWDADDQIADLARLYKAVLGRAPDMDGLRFWNEQANHGVPDAAIANQFANSAEFTNRFPGGSDAEFVNAVYQNALGRGIDATGQAFWLDQLAHGMTRGEMVGGVSHSTEFLVLSAGLTEGGIVFA